MMLVQEFYQMLEKHDWYFNYSDDHSAWRRGNESLARLQAISKQVPLFATMFKDYSDHVWSGDSFGTEHKTKPKLEDYLQ